MAFETRKNRSYYYQKERDGKRVRSVYKGAGDVARFAAYFDGLERDERDAEREAARMERAAVLALDDQLDALGAIVKDVTAATLIVNGYHQHKREWRRKRA